METIKMTEKDASLLMDLRAGTRPKPKPATPLQRLNYSYAARRRSVEGCLIMAENVLRQYGRFGCAEKVKENREMILIQLNHGYHRAKSNLKGGT